MRAKMLRTPRWPCLPDYRGWSQSAAGQWSAAMATAGDGMMVGTKTSLLRVPAVQALLIQIFSFLLMLVLAFATARSGLLIPTIFLGALVQGALASAISHWRRQAPWWLLIQFLFPLGLVVVLRFELPPSLFLAGFLFLLALYWTTFRTQVPFYPSGPATWKAVDALLPQQDGLRFIDIGSGLGGLVLHLAAQRATGSFMGIELAPLPWLVSVARARIKRSRGRFVRGDYTALNLASYDVVFAYLSPAAMPALWQKAHSEMRPGTLLLSYEFPIPDVPPHFSIVPESNRRILFAWRM